MKAPSSMDTIHLWRLSFADPVAVPSNLQKLALDARTLRKGMLALLGYEDEGGDERQKLDRLMRSPEDLLSVESAIAVFRQAFVPEALMVPLIRRHLSETVGSNSVGEIDAHIENSNARPERQIRWASTLTKDSPAGRRALREIITSLPELRAALDKLGLGEEDTMDVLDELIQRKDEDLEPADASRIKGLQTGSQWSGVGVLDRRSAKAVGSTLDANWSAVAEIRSAHIPPSLIDFA